MISTIIAKTKYLVYLETDNMDQDELEGIYEVIRNGYDKTDADYINSKTLYSNILNAIAFKIINHTLTSSEGFAKLENEISKLNLANDAHFDIEQDNINTLFKFFELGNDYTEDGSNKFCMMPSIIHSSDESELKLAYCLHLLKTVNAKYVRECTDLVNSIISFVDSKKDVVTATDYFNPYGVITAIFANF